MKSTYLEQFTAARRAAVPIVAMTTPDYSDTIRTLSATLAAREGGDGVPARAEWAAVQWDAMRGIIPINNSGKIAAEAVNKMPDGKPGNPALVTANATEALTKSLDLLPKNSVLFYQNAHMMFDQIDPGARLQFVQSIANLRDTFKRNNRMLVLLTPSIKIPTELANDIVTIDVPLPGKDELEFVVRKTFKSAGVTEPADDQIEVMVDAVLGLSSFAAEQALAMSINRDGMDLEELWLRKKTIIEQNAGLTVHSTDVTFDKLGGLNPLKEFLRRVIKGKRSPRLIVLIDEIDRQMAGLNDSNGINSDAYGQWLSSLQDNEWSGTLFPGFAGTGKTEIANAMGNEAGGLFIKLDMGGMKSKYVGDSEGLVRNAIKTLKAMGGKRVFFVGTTNNPEAIRPELKRRFSYGTWFFDLPTKAEQEPIWDIWMTRFSLDKKQARPASVNWSGADIMVVCKFADEMGVSLVEASNYISPSALSMGADGIERMKKLASGKYLSANKAGFYDADLDIVARAIDPSK